MRAKLRAISVVPYFHPHKEGEPQGDQTSESLVFMAVGPAGSYPADGTDENNSYALWTPSADLKMTVNNPALFGAIQQHQEFYVDFTRAVKEPIEDHTESKPADPQAELVRLAKGFRKDLDETLQRMKVLRDELHGASLNGVAKDSTEVIPNLVLSIRHVEDAIMRQGMFLKAVGNPNPYPTSYDPSSPVVEPTADGLKL